MKRSPSPSSPVTFSTISSATCSSTLFQVYERVSYNKCSGIWDREEEIVVHVWWRQIRRRMEEREEKRGHRKADSECYTSASKVRWREKERKENRKEREMWWPTNMFSHKKIYPVRKRVISISTSSVYIYINHQSNELKNHFELFSKPHRLKVSLLKFQRTNEQQTQTSQTT